MTSRHHLTRQIVHIYELLDIWNFMHACSLSPYCSTASIAIAAAAAAAALGWEVVSSFGLPNRYNVRVTLGSISDRGI